MPQSLQNIIGPLLDWFTYNKRELPWRADRDPYRVWISEIMLQQTRIEAVMGYYARFLDALPDVKSLSEVDDDALMKLWEGLGYYSRARNLKKAAITIVNDHGGVFPSSFSELIRLPGIGEYTAGAIASICFDEKAPAVDGNVLRVIARVQGSRDNVLLPETKKRVAAELSAVMPDRAGEFNEALMELGELVCLPNGAPLCENCPLKELCTAFQTDLTAELPVRVKKTKRRRTDLSVFIITSSDGRIAIEKRPDSGLLAGLYQLPNTEGFLTENEIAQLLADWDIIPVSLTRAKSAKHVFTHVDWHMKCYSVAADAASGSFLWVTQEELKSAYSLPAAFQKLLPSDNTVIFP